MQIIRLTMESSSNDYLASMLLKISESFELYWSKLNSSGNAVHMPQFNDEWAGLAGHFSCWLKNSSEDFTFFFNCYGCRLPISH